MNKLHFLFLLNLLCINSKMYCQSGSKQFYLNYKFVETTKKKALYIADGKEEKGLYVLNCYYKYNKKLAVIAHFTDASLSVLEGKYSSFYKKKAYESDGNYSNGKKDGLWIFWDSKGKIEDSIIYKNDKRIWEKDFYYFENGTIKHIRFTDFEKEIFISTTYLESGKKKREYIESNKVGFIKSYMNDIVQIDTMEIKKDIKYTKEDTIGIKFAEFKGGIKNWSKFLINRLDPNIPTEKGAPEGTFTVIIKFIILKNGEVEGVNAETNHGYGMEREVMRLIYETPNWTSATKNGEPIISTYRQPVTFQVIE